MNDGIHFDNMRNADTDQNASSVQEERTPPSQQQVTNDHQHAYHSYYNSGGSTSNDQNYRNDQVYDSRWDGQCVDEIEEHREMQFQQQIQDEVHALNVENQQLPPSPFQGRAIPNLIVSLAQKLLPTVVQRLNHHDEIKINRELDGEQFGGLCAPLGNSKTVQVPEAITTNYKTTGLDDEHFDASNVKEESKSDLEMGDPSEYLPESAALLIAALNGSSKKGARKQVDLPSLLDEALKDGGVDGNEEGIDSFDNFEREAEALLKSIQNEDNTEDNTAVAASPEASSTNCPPTVVDDDDSIGGDMVRLSHSIAFLQQDLENLDMSHFDGLYEDDLDRFDGEGSVWSRMKLWFSRGMIMEQKLLNSVNEVNYDEYSSGVNTTAETRYRDNPVLVWSIAIMWAFILLIIGHSKVADWVESEDPGRLADIIEWIFS